MKLFNESFTAPVSIAETDFAPGKEIFIEGVFAGSEHRNRNNRIYKQSVLKREVEAIQPKIQMRNLLGEFEHPDNCTVNAANACILIEKLEMEGNDAIGKAKVMRGTPMGDLLAGLLQNGVQMGVSTRGVGDLEEGNIVADNYKLITVDVVLVPSNQDSYVNAVNESFEWVLNESNGLYVERAIQQGHASKEVNDVELSSTEIVQVQQELERFNKLLDDEGSKAAKDAFISFLKALKKPKSTKNWLS